MNQLYEVKTRETRECTYRVWARSVENAHAIVNMEVMSPDIDIIKDLFFIGTEEIALPEYRVDNNE